MPFILAWVFIVIVVSLGLLLLEGTIWRNPITAIRMWYLKRKAKRLGWSPILYRKTSLRNAEQINTKGVPVPGREYIFEYRDGSQFPKYRLYAQLLEEDSRYDYRRDEFDKWSAETKLVRLFREQEQIPDWAHGYREWTMLPLIESAVFAVRVEPQFKHKTWGSMISYLDNLLPSFIMDDTVHANTQALIVEYSGAVYKKNAPYSLDNRYNRG